MKIKLTNILPINGGVRTSSHKASILPQLSLVKAPVFAGPRHQGPSPSSLRNLEWDPRPGLPLSGLRSLHLHPTLRQDPGVWDPSALLPLDPGVQAPQPSPPSDPESKTPAPPSPNTEPPRLLLPQTQDSRPPGSRISQELLAPGPQPSAPQNHSPVSPALLSPSCL